MSDGVGCMTGKIAEIGGGRRRRIRLLEIIGNGIVGGMETYTRNLIAALPKDEFEITCILPYESAYTASLRDLGCRTYVTPIHDDPLWRSIELGCEVVKLHHVDVIHANLANAHTLAGIVGRMTNTPTVATIHARSLWIQELSVAKVTGNHLITVCQEAFCGALAAGIEPDNLSLIRNGVDTSKFTPERSGAAFRESIGVDPSATLVGFVGRLSWEKGPDKFIQVAERVAHERPDTHFVLVGEGPIEPDLRHQIAQTRLEDRIHLAGLRRDVENVYPAFDLLLQTSRSEAMPLALLEGMASGVPVVAIAIGGVAEIVEVGVTGLLVSPGDWPGISSQYPGDWEGIAAATSDLLRQPDRLRRMRDAARRRAVREFDLAISARETAALLSGLVRPAAVMKNGQWQPTVVREKPDGERRGRIKTQAGAIEPASIDRAALPAMRALDGP